MPLTFADRPPRIDLYGYIDAATDNPLIARDAKAVEPLRAIVAQLDRMHGAGDLVVVDPEHSPGGQYPQMVADAIASCRARLAVLRAAADGATAAIDAAETAYRALSDKAFPPA